MTCTWPICKCQLFLQSFTIMYLYHVQRCLAVQCTSSNKVRELCSYEKLEHASSVLLRCCCVAARLQGSVPMATSVKIEHVYSGEALCCFSSHTEPSARFYKHQPTNEHQSACSHTEGLFMCHKSQQRTQTPVLCSLITLSAIISTNELCKVQWNTLLTYHNTGASSCCIAFWYAEVMSFWLYVGGIHCVARGCCQWWIPPPGLPSSRLWLQTAQQRKTHSFINKVNGSRSTCLRLLKWSSL